MAFTDKEKADIRRALGWPARFHQHDSRLEQAMCALEQLPDHEDQIRELLECVAACREALKCAWPRLKATEVGTIKMKTLHEELAGLRWEGRRLVGEISSILGVPRGSDAFGGGGHRSRGFGGFGDYWDGGRFTLL